MFSSMYSDLISGAKQCIFACARKLVPLFSQSFPSAQVVDLDDAAAIAGLLDSIDVQSAAGSMGRWLRPSLSSFKRQDWFLSPASDRVSYWKKRLADLGPELNVGISWRSGNMKGDRSFYCTTIDQWGPVLKVSGIRFVNLQYDECSDELAKAKSLFDVSVVTFPEVDLFNDIAESAALTKALDIVISAPNASAILAGAVGVPSWMMMSGFNWQKFGTAENCWYSSVLTFNKTWDQDWSGLTETIADQLRKKVGERRDF